MRKQRATKAVPSVRAAPALAIAPLQKDAQDALDIPVQADPTGPYGVAVARLSSGEGVRSSGTPADPMFGFHHSQSVAIRTWLCGRRFDHVADPGCFVLIPNGADCVCEIDGAFVSSVFRVSAECFSLAKSQLASPNSALIECPKGRDDALFQVSRALEAEAAAGHPNGMMFWSSAADALVRHLVEHHLSNETLPAQGSLSAQELGRLEAYVHANLAGPLDLEGLAAIVGCDRFHFARRFRTTVGVPPHRYVVRLRLNRARALMQARSGSLAEIALATGFYDQSHLGNWLRRVYGATPRQLMHG